MKSFNYNEQKIEFSISQNNIHIKDSYKIKSYLDMWNILTLIKEFSDAEGYIYTRSVIDWIKEWAAHNWLYEKNIAPDRTGSVDLSETESKIRLFAYKILSNIYFYKEKNNYV